jgi:hypothetical protein
MAEYVCLDGRMSVNGICPASSYPGYQDPTEDTVTSPITNVNQNVSNGDGKDTFTKDYSKDVKSNFQWDFDKVGNKIANFGNTVKDNITAYDKYVEENLGISKNVSNVFRAGAVVKGAATYGALGVLAPFAIPFLAGGALNSKQEKENERITNITNQDTQGGDNTVDMATYGIPTAGQTGFNIHNDAYDNSGNGGYNDGDGGSYSGAGEAADWGGGE